MLSLSEEVKNAYRKDSTDKQIVISFGNNTDVSGVNFYFGLYNATSSGRLGLAADHYIPINPGGDSFASCINYDYLQYAEYAIFSVRFVAADVSQDLLDYPVEYKLTYVDKRGATKTVVHEYNIGEIAEEIFSSTSGGKRIQFVIPANELEYISEVRFSNWNQTVDYNCGFTWCDYMFELTNNQNDYMENFVVSPIYQGHDIEDYVTIDTENIQDITNSDLIAESFSMNEALCSQDNIKFGACESSYVDFSIFGRNDNFKNKTLEINQYVGNNEESVPLGKYTVTSVKKESNKNKKTITAYDGLLALNNSADDWYTMYMFGVNTEDASRYGMEYARQIFSTYYNIAKYLGIESDAEYDKTQLFLYDRATIHTTYETTKYLKYSSNVWIKYAKFTIANPDVKKLYKMECEIYGRDWPDTYTEKFIIDSFVGDSYKNSVDELARGIINKGTVMVKETRTDHYTNTFLCDMGDCFMLSPDTTSIDIYIPFCTCGTNGVNISYLLDSVSFYKVDREIDLTNGAVRLMYYNWSSKEVFPCENGITARDVFRSLLEPCGCFFKLNRYGKPQFYYCTKSALYPSETLYPNEVLLPRGNTGVISRSCYISFEQEDYEVHDFGKIQIKKSRSSNDGTGIAEWEYIGDVEKTNAYIIEDNIFYSAPEMEYEYDSMPEVSEMLEGMFTRINNMGYVPCDVKAVGLPYLEPGDRITLMTENSAIETFVFSRNLSGIQSMKDNYESKGDEYNEVISDYGYKEWKGEE